MMRSVKGVYHNGKIQLSEEPEDITEAQVIVTFLPRSPRRADAPPLSPEETVELRGMLAAWEEDWNAPGMEAYDDYEARRRGPRVVPSQ